MLIDRDFPVAVLDCSQGACHRRSFIRQAHSGWWLSIVTACRYGVVVEPSRIGPGRKKVNKAVALKHLLALMTACASPALVSRYSKHVEAYKEVYRSGASGPDALASVAASQAVFGRTSPSQWEHARQSHWVPPFLSTIARREVRDGMAKCMRSVAPEWEEAQHREDFGTHRLVGGARAILGASGDASSWIRWRVHTEAQMESCIPCQGDHECAPSLGTTSQSRSSNSRPKRAQCGTRTEIFRLQSEQRSLSGDRGSWAPGKPCTAWSRPTGDLSPKSGLYERFALAQKLL